MHAVSPVKTRIIKTKVRSGWREEAAPAGVVVVSDQCRVLVAGTAVVRVVGPGGEAAGVALTGVGPARRVRRAVLGV